MNRHNRLDGFRVLAIRLDGFRFALPILLVLAAAPVGAERIKDLAAVAGVRSNQLLGYGLVVGLDGTGDKDSDSPFMVQSVRSMLTRLGVQIPVDVKLKPKNVAAVMLSAELPPRSWA